MLSRRQDPHSRNKRQRKTSPMEPPTVDCHVLNARQLTACLHSDNPVLLLLSQMWKLKDKEERHQKPDRHKWERVTAIEKWGEVNPEKRDRDEWQIPVRNGQN